MPLLFTQSQRKYEIKALSFIQNKHKIDPSTIKTFPDNSNTNKTLYCKKKKTEIKYYLTKAYQNLNRKLCSLKCRWIKNIMFGLYNI